MDYTYKSYLSLHIEHFCYFVLITYFKVISLLKSSFIQQKKIKNIQIIHKVIGRRIDFFGSLVFPARRVLGVPQRNPEKYLYRHGTVNGLQFVYELLIRKMLSKFYSGYHARSFFFAVDLLTYCEIRSFSGTVTNIRQQRKFKKNIYIGENDVSQLGNFRPNTEINIL